MNKMTKHNGPSREWITKMAAGEDAVRSTSVGGMAADFGALPSDEKHIFVATTGNQTMNILTKLEELEDDANLVFLNAEVRRLSEENDRLQKAYDSSKDTLLHIRRVSELLHAVIADFAERASAHDASKLESPEKELFDEFTPLLKSTTYGSKEYEDYLSRLKVALDHHYQKNSHHPEHHQQGIYGMNLFDLLEMLVDWKAATERHADGDMEKSLDINVGRFHISHELYHILKNTIEYMSNKKEWNLEK